MVIRNKIMGMWKCRNLVNPNLRKAKRFLRESIPQNSMDFELKTSGKTWSTCIYICTYHAINILLLYIQKPAAKYGSARILKDICHVQTSATM